MATKQRANVVSRGFLDSIRVETKNQITSRYRETSFCDDLHEGINLKKWLALGCLSFAGSVTGFFYLTKHYGQEHRSCVREVTKIVPSRTISFDSMKYKTVASTMPRMSANTAMKTLKPSSHLNTILDLCEKYKIDLELFSLAAIHFRPVEFHLQTCEWLLEKIEAELVESKDSESFPKDLSEMKGYVNSIVDRLSAERPYFTMYANLFTQILDLTEKQATLSLPVKWWIETLREALHQYLVANWDRERYFDPVSFREGYFGRRHTEQAEGLDIGSRGSSYLFDTSYTSNESCALYRAAEERQKAESHESDKNIVFNNSSETPMLSENDLASCLSTIRKYGFVIIKNALLKDEVNYVANKVFSHNAIAAEGYDALEKFDPNIDCRRPTRGRLHCLLRGSIVEGFLSRIQRVWMPLVYGTLKTEKDFNVHGLCDFKRRGGQVTDWMAENNDEITYEPRRLFLSDLQLVTADPLATYQFWHSDSLKPGLTVVVPLANSQHGSNELLPGSHHFHPETTGNLPSWFQKWKYFYSCYQDAGGTMIAELEPGDVLVYDSRLCHRGTDNKSWDTSPSLVFRYDYNCYPPPGQTISQSNYNRFRASILQRISGIYNAL